MNLGVVVCLAVGLIRDVVGRQYFSNEDSDEVNEEDLGFDRTGYEQQFFTESGHSEHQMPVTQIVNPTLRSRKPASHVTPKSHGSLQGYEDSSPAYLKPLPPYKAPVPVYPGPKSGYQGPSPVYTAHLPGYQMPAQIMYQPQNPERQGRQLQDPVVQSQQCCCIKSPGSVTGTGFSRGRVFAPAPGFNPGPGFGSAPGFSRGAGVAPNAGFRPGPGFATGAGFRPGPGLGLGPGFRPGPGLALGQGFSSVPGFAPGPLQQFDEHWTHRPETVFHQYRQPLTIPGVQGQLEQMNQFRYPKLSPNPEQPSYQKYPSYPHRTQQSFQQPVFHISPQEKLRTKPHSVSHHNANVGYISETQEVEFGDPE